LIGSFLEYRPIPAYPSFSPKSQCANTHINVHVFVIQHL